ncbi:RsmB/NOP family class I SAM-dependent RNA methyltransferase [Paraoerskovia marina]|uniref:RsmB/NOP family class I SAM-dependent RNA methyltransferase n=1 Tax=Paraoerskovia marina TaxID=545619 RepID=UPI000492E323|nr:transcription antitermination factor NusB [Paraoerskovia marina]
MSADRRDAKGRQRGAARARGARNQSQQAPGQRRRTGDPARNAAYDVLRQVADSDAYANLVLPPLLRERGIVGRDAAFATELAYGTLRMLGRYDAVLAQCVDRPLDRVDPAVLDVLRLGAHQVLGMRVATHAAVSETVALTRERVGAGPAQFVNAVLRKVSARPLGQWLEVLASQAPDDLARLAVTQSHPAWITRALREALVASGRSASELGDLLAADNEAPRVTLVARPGLSAVADLNGAEPGRWATTAAVLQGSDPGALEAVRDGTAGVQDEGSQLVTLALAGAVVDGPDERWLDMCAGPGGKAALLGAIAAERGARVVANESQEHRTELVRRSMKAVPRAAVESIRTGDGRDIGTDEPAAYDRVLLDAPCTGLGALRRRPESRWRRTPSDLGTLTALQRELLDSALDAVRPGGVVGYVTCSPHMAETQVVVDDVLRRRADVERLDAAEAVRAVATTEIPLTDRTDVQLWPHVHGTDAMHLTLLRRRA